MTDERAKLIDHASPEEALKEIKQAAEFQMMHHLLNTYGIAGMCTMMRAHLDQNVKAMRPLAMNQVTHDAVNDLEKLSLAIEGVEDMARAQAKASAEKFKAMAAEEG